LTAHADVLLETNDISELACVLAIRSTLHCCSARWDKTVKRSLFWPVDSKNHAAKNHAAEACMLAALGRQMNVAHVVDVITWAMAAAEA